MRRPTSRADTSEVAYVTDGGTAAKHRGLMDVEAPAILPRMDEEGHTPRRGFARDLVLHTLFSLGLVCLIVTGLRLEKKPSSRAPREATPTAAAAAAVEFSSLAEDELEALVTRQRRAVVAMRRAGTVMETDPAAIELTRSFRNASSRLLAARYGPGPTYRVAIRLLFPRSMGGTPATVVVETAPIDVMPHAVHVFLDAAVTKRLRPDEKWSAAFHRNAGHVLQAFVRAPDLQGLAFQEYDARFPHRKYTLGFAGRPGGPEFYISTVDNTRNHGPGSQGSKTEADSCFAKIVDGFDVVERMRSQPAPKGLGFVTDPGDFIHILGVDILNYFPGTLKS